MSSEFEFSFIQNDTLTFFTSQTLFPASHFREKNFFTGKFPRPLQSGSPVRA